ncbi:MAG: hypothetical protein Q4G71_17475 [Pseudomonadota bacterium]|nr:hypothetical protein [Pseudomonadota bacterium]
MTNDLRHRPLRSAFAMCHGAQASFHFHFKATSIYVIPAQAGIQQRRWRRHWIAACAAMTNIDALTWIWNQSPRAAKPWPLAVHPQRCA